MGFDIHDLHQTLSRISESFSGLKIAMKLDAKSARIAELDRMMGDSGFWDNPGAARPILQEQAKLKKTLETVKELASRIEDALTLAELTEEAQNEGAENDLRIEIDKLAADFRRFEILTLMSGENDARNVIMSIHAGAGGTESCDWVSMLLRMYTRWLDNNDFKYEQTQILAGEEAGIRSVTLEIQGFCAYGYLRSESGVHRLVRISPFDSNARRHTTFSSVDVLPFFDDVEVNIDENDLKIDTHRAGGPGGQHVNKTESAVRITHLPTGIVVQCQSQRSQIKNRQMAMRELAARVQRFFEAQRDAELKALIGERGEIAWGNQIRSYVMQPYTLVKDHRTDYEETDIRKVLDGSLDGFIEAYLRNRLAKDSVKES
jgi:peptide chain release factor 2